MTPALPPISAEYLACLFDGEGTITAHRRWSGQGAAAPLLQLVNTDKGLLGDVKSQYGGSLRLRAKVNGRKPVYEVRWHSVSNIRRILDVIEPWLRCKRGHAVLLRRIIELVGRGRPQADRDLAIDLVYEIQGLNTRGVEDEQAI